MVFIAEGSVSNDIQQPHVGFAHTETLKAYGEKESFSL